LHCRYHSLYRRTAGNDIRSNRCNGTSNGSTCARSWYSVLAGGTLLTGVIQFLFGVLKIAKLMKFIPRAVMIGFVNALAILIFLAQVLTSSVSLHSLKSLLPLRF